MITPSQWSHQRALILCQISKKGWHMRPLLKNCVILQRNYVTKRLYMCAMMGVVGGEFDHLSGYGGKVKTTQLSA